MSPDPRKVSTLVGDLLAERIDRRQFLSRAVALGLSTSAASACLPRAVRPPAARISTSSASAIGTKTLTYRPEVDIANLDPAFFVSQDDFDHRRLHPRGSRQLPPGTFDVVNTLADTLETSADKLQYHFKLKQGIEWQKGYGEVRASDVKFSFERIAGLTKPNLKSPYSGDWQALETVQAWRDPTRGRSS